MIEIKRLPEFDEWLDGIKDNIVMLGGGDKSTQQQDINRAVKLSKTLED